MARRRDVVAQAGAFDRTPEQWHELGAPAFVYQRDAAAEAYVAWAVPGFGGRRDPADPLVWFYYVSKIWMPRCCKPQYLAHVDALTSTEVALLAANQWARWDRPGHCRSKLLAGDAPVPSWLESCRRRDAGGWSRDGSA